MSDGAEVTESCDACRFWQEETEGEYGLCRRLSPRWHPMDGRSESFDAHWPETRPEDWCGEYEPPKPDGANGDDG